MEFWAFSSKFVVGIVSYARTTIIHGYSIAITFARKIFEHSASRPRVLHEKPWVIPKESDSVD